MTVNIDKDDIGVERITYFFEKLRAQRGTDTTAGLDREKDV